MRRLLVLPILLAVAALAAPSAQAAGCDATGDAYAADDCIAHAHVGATADGRVEPGERIRVRQRLHRALRGEALVTEVQFRRVLPSGKRGPWLAVHRSRWAGSATAKGRTRTVGVCRAVLAGRYQFRTIARVPRAATREQAGRQAPTTEVATSAPSGVAMPTGSMPGVCENTDDDETNVELFNMWSFMDVIELGITSTISGRANAFTLSCPEPEPGMPSTLGIALFLQGQSTGVACNGPAPLALDAAELYAGGYDACPVSGGVPRCRLVIVAYDTATKAIYSETYLIATMAGSSTVIPELEPATLPLCDSTISPCLIAGSCSLSTSKEGSIQLCDSPEPCQTPSKTTGTGYADSIYFTSILNSKP